MQNKDQRIFEPTLFREYLKSKMISLLDSIAGRKLFLLEEQVRTPINLVIERKVFSEHGVPEEDGIRSFQPMIIPNNFDQIVIFLRPTGQNLIRLKEIIDMNKEKGNKKYFPCFWPKRNIICKQFFQINGLTSYVDVRDFSFDLLPLDADLYSLEMKFLKQLYISHDHSIYTTVAQSIHRLQCVFGKIHNIYGKGKAAKAIYDILKLKQNEIKIDQNYGDIQSVIIIDRSIDFLTPLLKQTVYEGVADQIYGIKGNIVRVPSSKIKQQGAGQKKNDTGYKTFKLSSEKDYIYQSIKGLALFASWAIFKIKGAEHDNFREEACAMKDLTEKGKAFKRINLQKEFLATHLNLIPVLLQDIKSIGFNMELMLQHQAINDEKDTQLLQYYENMIPFDAPLENILKNMSIQCIINRGIPPKVYSKICDDICFTYGMQHIVSLTHLANLGLFYEAKSIRQPYPFNDIKKELKLISDADIDYKNPQDTAFAYGGYTPISAKLVEHAIRNGWRLIQKGLRVIPGEIVMPQFSKVCQSHPRPAVVVYFVGGVTYGQIAAIRLLSKFLKREIIVATTEVINGDTFIKQLLD